MIRSKSIGIRKTFLIMLSMVLAACSDRGEVDMPVGLGGDDVVAVVNGQPVSGARLQMFAARRTGGQAAALTPEQRQELIGELVEMELLVQAAQARGLHRDPEMAAHLLGSYKSILANAFLQEHMLRAQPSEEDLHAAYQARQERDGLEYRARHILVDSEDKARAIINELEQGGDFSRLARQHSQGPSSGKGGDLGWFSLDAMVPAFREAVAGMQAGELTAEPVRTGFGWHVILLEQIREWQRPDFEDMRDKLEHDLRLEMLETVVADLRGNARIRIKGND